MDSLADPERMRRVRPSLSDRLKDMACRAAAAPGFRRWAAATPIARRFARRETEAVFDLVAGFIHSQLLFAFVESGMLDALAEGPTSADALAKRCGLPQEGSDRLLCGAVSLGLAGTRSGERYGLGMRGAALLDNPGVTAMIRHHQDVYRDLADPLALLRNEVRETRTNRFWRYLAHDEAAALSDAEVEEYSGLMAISQAMIAEAVTASFPFHRHRRILDVGGGTGAFLSQVAKVAPESALTLFDLPGVAAVARKSLSEQGLGDRIACVGGSFHDDALPPDQDLITLVRVVYDHSDATVATVLDACRAALAPGGVLLIAEPVSGEEPGARVADAYFGLYLAAMGSGRTRRLDDHRALLKMAGFGEIKLMETPLPGLARLIVAAV
ncbi:MAG: methyltransferase [Alphaproteobacteria bacterium]|nr:methyltransferase [Alphaproteobacteria bacterium]